jgi:hypothetical protein
VARGSLVPAAIRSRLSRTRSPAAEYDVGRVGARGESDPSRRQRAAAVEGGITKRLGTQATSAAAIVAATPVRGGYSWRKPTSAVEELVVCDGKALHRRVLDRDGLDEQAGALAAGVVPSFAGFIAGAAPKSRTSRTVACSTSTTAPRSA